MTDMRNSVEINNSKGDGDKRRHCKCVLLHYEEYRHGTCMSYDSRSHHIHRAHT